MACSTKNLKSVFDRKQLSFNDINCSPQKRKMKTPHVFKRDPQYKYLFPTPEGKKRRSNVRKQLKSPSPLKTNISEPRFIVQQENDDSEILAIPLEAEDESFDPDDPVPSHSVPLGSAEESTPAGPQILHYKKRLSTGRKLAQRIADELSNKRVAVNLLSKEKATLLELVKNLQNEVQELKNDLVDKDEVKRLLLVEETNLKSEVSKLGEYKEKLRVSEEKLRTAEEKVAQLENLCKVKEDENKELSTRMCTALRSSTELSEKLKEEKERLHIESISCLDFKIAHYTGIPNAGTFFLNYTFVYYHFNVTSISRENQLLLTLMRLKLGLKRQTLANWFNCSTQTVTNIVNTWLDALHVVLFQGFMKEIPSLRKVQKCLPECFKPFPNCRIVLDCTEVETAVPKSMRHHNLTYSQYKHRTTHKGLVGIALNGTVVFASKLYPGSTSDKSVVDDSKICELFNAGESIMVDKGFLITDFLPPGASLIRPPFKTTPQFTEQQVCCALTNLKNPLLKEVSKAMGQCACYSDEED
ncbi:Kinesin-like protein KIN-14C [Frankliniella fusca]|uniref:Kinesin-like protein KIN-14C n=1 Tax=Frankliniella fusca TaxID=407009 RepID=A0AAE1HBD9_9NEOP|nr:Kinesin-like protein KIN-14C [Frankliniella fusca]